MNFQWPWQARPQNNGVLTRSQTRQRIANRQRLENEAKLRKNNVNIARYWATGSKINIGRLLTRNLPMATRILLQGRPSAQNLRNLSSYVGRQAGFKNAQSVENIYRLMLYILELRTISPDNANNQKRIGEAVGTLVAQLIKSRPTGNGKQQVLTKAIITGIIRQFMGERAARLYVWKTT